MNLDIGANRQIDESRVPDHLKHLIPIVNRWGFEKLDDQDTFVKKMLVERPDELQEFNILYDTHRDQLHEWACSIPKKHKSEMTEDDWSHPHWGFVSLYKIREITGPGLETEAEKLAMERHRKEVRAYRFEQASIKAHEAFRKRRFLDYIELLGDYGDLLSGIQKKKISLARKRTQDS